MCTFLQLDSYKSHVAIKIVSLVIFTAVSSKSSSQTIIRIIDQSSHSVLPLATIVNLTKTTIQFADDNGSFVFEWNDADSIRVTHIGYFDVVTQLRKIANNTIQLIPKPALMPNVIVKPCMNRVNDEYNNFNPPANYTEFGGMSWSDNIEGAKAAILIRHPIGGVQLSQLEFELKKTFTAPKKTKEFPKSPIRFSFYLIDDETGLPSEQLTTQVVIYTPKKIGKQIVMLDSLHLVIPDSGLYIGIEYLVDSKYCYPVQFQPSVYADSVIMQYPLMFDGVRSKDFRLAFYDYRKSNWYFSNPTKESAIPNATIKFGIRYSYCDDAKNFK